MTFGERVRKYRKLAHLTQEAVAFSMGYKSRESISQIEVGRSSLSADQIRKLSMILGCSVQDLIDPNECDKKEARALSYIPYLVKAEEWQITAINKILGIEDKDND